MLNNTYYGQLNSGVWSTIAHQNLADLSDENSTMQKLYPFLQLGLSTGLDALINRNQNQGAYSNVPSKVQTLTSNIDSIREQQLLKNNITPKPNNLELSGNSVQNYGYSQMLRQVGNQPHNLLLNNPLNSTVKTSSFTSPVAPKLELSSVNQALASADDAVINAKSFSNFNTPGGLQPSTQITPLQAAPSVTSSIQPLAQGTPQNLQLAGKPLQSGVDVSKTTSATSSALNAAKGAGASMAAGLAVNVLGDKLGTTKTKAGQFGTGLVAQGAGMAAGAAATGQSLSSLGSAANLASAGFGVANLALDVFDPVKKHWAENVVGLGGAVAALAIPGAGPFIAAGLLAANAIGHITGKKTQEYARDTEMESQLGGSYGGFLADSAKAMSLQGTKYSGFNDRARKKADRFIDRVQDMRDIMWGIQDEANTSFALRNSMSAINQNRKAFELQGGYQQGTVHAAKHGGVLRAKRIISASRFKEGGSFTNSISNTISLISPVDIEGISIINSVDSEQLPEFKEGGTIEKQESKQSIIQPIEIEEIVEFKEGGSFNVIPDGALHAHLHHMENSENLTRKGIPVVSEDENGELEQHAEIERNEIILRLEVTKELEKLQEKYYSNNFDDKEKDNFAIEAGKLLVYEILENTVDNTGLLNEI